MACSSCMGWLSLLGACQKQRVPGQDRRAKKRNGIIDRHPRTHQSTIYGSSLVPFPGYGETPRDASLFNSVIICLLVRPWVASRVLSTLRCFARSRNPGYCSLGAMVTAGGRAISLSFGGELEGDDVDEEPNLFMDETDGSRDRGFSANVVSSPEWTEGSWTLATGSLIVAGIASAAMI